jgi:Thioredoxin
MPSGRVIAPSARDCTVRGHRGSNGHGSPREDLFGPRAPHVQPTHVADGTFVAEVLRSDLPVVVDFWSPGCGPCRMLEPIVMELASAYAGRVKTPGRARRGPAPRTLVSSYLGALGAVVYRLPCGGFSDHEHGVARRTCGRPPTCRSPRGPRGLGGPAGEGMLAVGASGTWKLRRNGPPNCRTAVSWQKSV